MHQLVKKLGLFLTLLWCIKVNAFTLLHTDSRFTELEKLSWTDIPAALKFAKDLEQELEKTPNDHAQAKLFNITGYT